MGTAAEVTALKSLRGDIIEHLTPRDTVLGYLSDKGYITEWLYEEVGQVDNRSDQARILIDEIIRKELAAEFLEALEYQQSHKNLASRLRSKIRELKAIDVERVDHLLPEQTHLWAADDIADDHDTVSGDLANNIQKQIELLDTPLYRHPARVEIMGKKHNMLIRINFELHNFSHDGEHGRQQFSRYIFQLGARFWSDSDVKFERLYAIGTHARIFNQDLSELELIEMERLVASTTHSDCSAMRFLARKGNSFAMRGDLEQGLQILEAAKSKFHLLTPGIETGRVLFVYVDILLKYYEIHPNVHTKKVILNTIQEGIEYHLAKVPADMKYKYQKNFLIKMAFCLLGIGVHCRLISCIVTDEDLQCAERCLQRIETIPGVTDNRRKMFIHVAKAVLSCNRGRAKVALHHLVEAECIATRNNFYTDAKSIEVLKPTLCPEPVNKTNNGVPVDETKQIVPVDETNQVVPVDETNQVVPVDETNQVVPVDETNQVVPVDETKQIVPVDETNQVVPVDETNQDGSVEETNHLVSAHEINQLPPLAEKNHLMEWDDNSCICEPMELDNYSVC